MEEKEQYILKISRLLKILDKKKLETVYKIISYLCTK